VRTFAAAFVASAAVLLGASGVLHAEEPPKTAILATVTASLAKQLGTTADKIAPDAKFSSLKPAPDELDVVELIMTLEEKFDIEITDAAIAKVVGSSALDAITSNLSAKSLSQVVADALK
jgi:acyl carrier protein